MIIEEKLEVEKWLAVRKEAALQIDPETAEVFWTYAKRSTPMAYTPIFRTSASRSDENTLLVLPEAIFGCGLVIYPRLRKTLYGKSTDPNWLFLQG